MRSVKTILLMIFCALLLAQAVEAVALQGDYFSISGRVTDANWNPIYGAKVTLFDNDFNVISTQETNENGSFYFQNVAVKTYLCTVRVSYDNHEIPGYYIRSYDATGDQHVGANETHYDNYYLPGSKPMDTPAPVPTPTPAPVQASAPAARDDGSPVQSILIFLCGSVTGAAVALIACLVVLRPARKP